MASATMTFINDVDQNNCTPQQKTLLLKMDAILAGVRSFCGESSTMHNHRHKTCQRCYDFSGSKFQVLDNLAVLLNLMCLLLLLKKKEGETITVTCVNTSPVEAKILKIILVSNIALESSISVT